ncbi:cell envelope integrity protein CreD [Fusobacterium varium]|jgi:inner membrane protein|uniref:Cell envelope integrity protein CreD n=1 Tax=Fusobacterium varium ATCC 27725 TaxID=469618 RepID=A0ABM6U7T2_FUSVA|nr:cell envelope integrity protein CreD [Fusobacterium varium]AVQ32458.1 cell envelope integrity protein CreD [Fusobacterium varium ATCC 27725]EES64397.1 inner membrane protein CreD [Fusobacterium varium ATCC 27725]VEH38570.1 Inner membrane protein CreD [Fusobacterium varium]
MKKKVKTTGNPMLKKALFLFFFSLLLQIPLMFVNGVVHERNYLYDSTIKNIGKEWGETQTIAGPVIVVPYTEEYYEREYTVDKQGKETEVVKSKKRKNSLIILPEKLDINVNLKEEVRKRGIYKSMVYTGELKMKGNFSKVLSNIPINAVVDYNEISISLGITDIKALLKIDKFSFNGNEIELESGTGLVKPFQISKGISGKLNMKNEELTEIPFDIELVFRGSEGITLLPMGKENSFFIKSAWKNPSFYGMLPRERVIDENGFSANWNISHLTRNYKQYFFASESNKIDLSEAQAGVALYNGITHYRQVIRAAKYGVLFIMMSLLAVYLFEISGKKETHYIQYGIVGFSLVMFYLLLLSLAEHISFITAYGISAAAVIIPVSLYIASVTKNIKYGIGMLVLLIGIYSILFSILKMEDYALLTGTLLIMGVLYLLMYITKNMEIINKKTPEIEDDDNEEQVKK